jgi:hypothetical protein
MGAPVKHVDHEIALAAAFFEQVNRDEINRIQRFGGDLTRARLLYRQWHASREAIGTTRHFPFSDLVAA